jgi:hypothetical protein
LALRGVFAFAPILEQFRAAVLREAPQRDLGCALRGLTTNMIV